ncbi:hypothetical protein H5410_064755 [Solanum commersonii]|uniref:Uncharacterized protein n=1 Tax=Solanum commersonii TaxID=4109 RepID=A0A9J5VYL4_SOLCO|nr:hypothetical protein H5410_064755 [Solanum commersonii]
MEELDGAYYSILRKLCVLLELERQICPRVLMMVAWEMLKNVRNTPLVLDTKPTREEISSANLKGKKLLKITLLEGLKTCSLKKRECNMILEGCREALTIWDAMHEDALNNWTCNSPRFSGNLGR